MTLSICTAQLNFVVGDLPGNTQKIITAAHEAHAAGAQLLLTPELALCGYAAEDLLLRPAFLAACDDAVKAVAAACAGLKGLVVVLGHPQRGEVLADGALACFNAASVLRHGVIEQTYAKQALPNYGVFDEQRHFTPGQSPCVFEVAGVRVGVLICEDAWLPAPAQATAQAGAELLAVINASPFHAGKSAERERAMRARVQETGLALVYAHMVGGQDELVFDGGSFALQADGTLAGRAPGFVSKLVLSHIQRALAALKIEADIAPEATPEAELWDALVLAVRDYVGKNGFPGVLLGLSGGMDSALVLAIAVDALGADKVRAVMMRSGIGFSPLPYGSWALRKSSRPTARWPRRGMSSSVASTRTPASCNCRQRGERVKAREPSASTITRQATPRRAAAQTASAIWPPWWSSSQM